MPAVGTSCANHRRRDRVASCGSCEKPLCRDCVVHTPVGIKCPACTGERVPTGRATRPTRAGRPSRAAPPTQARPPRPARQRPRWLLPTVLAAVVALVGLAVLVRSGGDSGEREVAEQDPADPSTGDSPLERKVELTGGGGTRIGATLLLPPRGHTAVAGVLIVPGFGSIDRDSMMVATSPDRSADRLSQDLNYSRPGTPDFVFRDLNDTFVASDMATLRYDKRGGGTSQLEASKPLSYDDLVADAKAGLDFLGQRVETASVPLFVVGVDQGGLIAMRLAGDPRVKAVVLASTFGRPLAEVIGDDLLASRGDEGPAESEQVRAVAARLAAGQPLPKPEELLPNLRALFVPLQEGYLRTVFGLDPVKEAAAVRVPVLLVRGAIDPSVTAADTERLRQVLPAGTGEIVVPDGDHNLGTNGRRDPAVMAQLAAWLRGHVGG